MCFGMQKTGQEQSFKDTNTVQNQAFDTRSNQTTAGTNNQATAGSSNQATTSTTALPAWLNQAAQQNYQFAQNIAGAPFQTYGGPMVASLTPDQLAAGARVRDVAASGNPYQAAIESAYQAYGGAPAGSVSSPSVLGGGYNAATGSIQDYLSPYIQAGLKPQLDQIERAGAVMRTGAGGLDSQATSAGAYGDTRNALENTEQMRNQAKLESDVTGQAYKDAFDRAAALRGTDVANLINTGTTNAGLREQQLARVLGSGGALQGLDKYTAGRAIDLANAQNQYGREAQTTEQARLQAAFDEFNRARGYPHQQLQDLIASLSGAAGNVNRTTTGATTGATAGTTAGQTTGTRTGETSGTQSGTLQGTQRGLTTKSAPNNAGWALLGNILGSAFNIPGVGGGGGGGGGDPTESFFRTPPSSFFPDASGGSSGLWGDSSAILGSSVPGLPMGAGMPIGIPA